MPRYRPKVFFIGFNKTATTAFHHLFLNNSYKSFHHSERLGKQRKYLGNIIKKNLEKRRNALTGADTFDCYSEMLYVSGDMYYDGIHDFKILDRQYPNSYFILQTRNEDDWIKSRLNHKSTGLSFQERCKTALNISNDSKLERYWRDKRNSHYNLVYDHFRNSSKFLVFDIDKDDIIKLKNFLIKDYQLNTKYWERHNVT